MNAVRIESNTLARFTGAKSNSIAFSIQEYQAVSLQVAAKRQTHLSHTRINTSDVVVGSDDEMWLNVDHSVLKTTTLQTQLQVA